MFGDESPLVEEDLPTEDLFRGSILSSSSSSPSMESAQSIIEPEVSIKVKLYQEGLYSPGSGEVCAKYVTMSRSSVLKHVYYEYPGVKDPGIVEALLFPPDKKVYDDDGQDLYLDLCKEMRLIPVRCFHRGLKESVINLRYYGVNPVGIRAMCLALANNKTVRRLDLTSNFLDHDDACYHLGQMFGDCNVLQELVLEGCKIGPQGVRKLVVLLSTRKMELLDLTGNNIQDEGVAYLADELINRAVIRRLRLKNNDLTSESLLLLSEAMEFNDSIRYLDLSWNRFIKMKGQATFIQQVASSEALVELNLSWTSISVSTELRNLFQVETLKILNLSNNKLQSAAARVIARCLHIAQSLEVLDVSGNPFTPADALFLLIRMRQERIKLKELHMQHIPVSKEFALELQYIKKLEYRRDTIITHGDFLRNYTLPEVDIKVITMRRLLINMKKKRKSKLDILMYFLEENKTKKFLDTTEFVRVLKLYDSPLPDTFVESFIKLFPGPRSEGGNRSINLNVIVDYIHRLWPEKKLPPTPPPLPPPPPPPPKSKKKGKGKKGKK